MIEAAWIERVLREAGLLRRAHLPLGGSRISGASQDSRQMRGGGLFVALPGENTDGHRFASDAMHGGAGGALLREESVLESLIAEEWESDLFLVSDPLAALQLLAKTQLSEVAPRVVAITGSNGKTGTKNFTAALLGTLGPSFASEGNYNNLIGLPMTLLGMPAETEYAVLEMGCSSFGEIERLCELFPPEIGVVTNIGAAHLEQLGDLEGVARAKGELAEALPADGLLVLHGEDLFADALAARSRARVKRFGLEAGGDLRVEDLGPAGLSARRLRLEGREMTLPLSYRHAFLSLAAAWVVARHLGGEFEALAAAASGATWESNRGGVYRLGPWTVMDDSYNANPESLRAALGWLAEARVPGRRWAVLGDMLELGEAGPALHEDCGRAAAALAIDGLLATGPLCRLLIDGARAAGLSGARHCEDHRALAAALLGRLALGDLVLLKGSRGMAMERVIEALEEELGQEREVLI